VIALIGVVCVLVCVFTSYVLSGGKISIIIQALPFEMLTLWGAAIGAFMIGNDTHIIKATLHSFPKIFKKNKWHKKDYIDILSCLYAIMKLVRSGGFVALESHIENPTESEIFQHFNVVLKDEFLLRIICDTFRVVTMNLDNPYHLEEHLTKQINHHYHDLSSPAHALQISADGIPALGIVAAVLGVIKTMASIDKPPIILGEMIGGALVGTFLGVFTAYGFVGPFATHLQQISDLEVTPYYIVRDVIVSFLQGNPPQVAVEVGRSAIDNANRPSFSELEAALEEVPNFSAKK